MWYLVIVVIIDGLIFRFRFLVVNICIVLSKNVLFVMFVIFFWIFLKWLIGRLNCLCMNEYLIVFLNVDCVVVMFIVGSEILWFVFR